MPWFGMYVRSPLAAVLGPPQALPFADNQELVEATDLSPRVLGGTGLANHQEIGKGSLKEKMENVEKLLLIRALAENDHNKTKTAGTLGITREGLHKKLNRFGLS